MAQCTDEELGMIAIILNRFTIHSEQIPKTGARGMAKKRQWRRVLDTM